MAVEAGMKYPSDPNPYGITFRNEGEQTYEVLCLGVPVGTVYYDHDGELDYKWFIDGDRIEYGRSTYNRRKRFGGCRTRMVAAEWLAKAQSSVVLANLASDR